MPIFLPPLRERPEDIPQLVTHFLNFYNEKNDRYVAHIEPRALEAMQRYAWPGNVRELQNYVERAVVMAPGDELTFDLLPEAVRTGRQPKSLGPRTMTFDELTEELVVQGLNGAGDDADDLHGKIVDRVEREVISQVHARCATACKSKPPPAWASTATRSTKNSKNTASTATTTATDGSCDGHARGPPTGPRAARRRASCRLLGTLHLAADQASHGLRRQHDVLHRQLRGGAWRWRSLGLWTRPRWRRLLVVVAAVAGIVAHTWYLGRRAGQAPVGAALQPARLVSRRRVGAGRHLRRRSCSTTRARRWACSCCRSRSASSPPRTGPATEPLASFAAPRFWGRVHGVFLMLGTVAVLLGLRRRADVPRAKLPAQAQAPDRRPLPPAQPRMARTRQQPLARRRRRCWSRSASSPASSLALAQADAGGVPWTDPVVLSLSGMLSWLVAAEAFRLAYPAARRGRKVAYLTLAGFVFLVLTLATFSQHDDDAAAKREQRARVAQIRNQKSDIRNRAVALRNPPPPPRRLPMNLRMVGCTHRATSVDVRQQLAFADDETPDALARWRARFPAAELVLLSTCNRVELYAAGANRRRRRPTSDQLVDALPRLPRRPARARRRPGRVAGPPRRRRPPLPRRRQPRQHGRRRAADPRPGEAGLPASRRPRLRRARCCTSCFNPPSAPPAASTTKRPCTSTA